MKPYLVDVPVRVNIWIRPECQKRQFEVLREARPSIIFLVSDGGRNEKEWEAIRQNREMIDSGIDWECTVYRIYEEKNNGIYAMGKKGRELIWSVVDRCIFLEDDQLPSISYFKFCQELLEKYKDDERVQAICGRNQLISWERASSDYFFATSYSIWGIATWKRADAERDYEHKYGKDPYIMELLKERTKKHKTMWNHLKDCTESGGYNNHVAGAEFFHSFEIYAQNRLFIIPKYNMINNIGCTTDGLHATEYKLMPRATKRLFYTKIYDYNFPLKHPDYVIADEEFTRQRDILLGEDHPFISFARKIESMFLRLRYQGIKGFIKKGK